MFDSLSTATNNSTILDLDQQQNQQSQRLLEYNQQMMHEQQQNPYQEQVQKNELQQQQQQVHCCQKTQYQQQAKLNTQMRSLYVGNLHMSITENKIYQFLELRSTKYLQEIWKFD